MRMYVCMWDMNEIMFLQGGFTLASHSEAKALLVDRKANINARNYVRKKNMPIYIDTCIKFYVLYVRYILLCMVSMQ